MKGADNLQRLMLGKLGQLDELQNITLAFQNQMKQIKQLLKSTIDLDELKVDVDQIQQSIDSVDTKASTINTTLGTVNTSIGSLDKNMYYSHVVTGLPESVTALRIHTDIDIEVYAFLVDISGTATTTKIYIESGDSYDLMIFDTTTNSATQFWANCFDPGLVDPNFPLRVPLLLPAGNKVLFKFNATSRDIDAVSVLYKARAEATITYPLT